jgi:hypothetical protein
MTIVFIENVWGSGQIVTVSEAFKDHQVSRRLKPGESLRIAVSPFKSISIDEEAIVEPGGTVSPKDARVAEAA